MQSEMYTVFKKLKTKVAFLKTCNDMNVVEE